MNSGISGSGLADAVAIVVGELEPELIAFRRDLHAHPEPAHQEHRTTAKVAEALTCAGLKPKLLARTGLICEVGGQPDWDRQPGEGGGIVAIRADIDALPLEDSCGKPWASQTAGWAHGCGHDLHTTAAVGAALALAKLEGQGVTVPKVRFIFQPAEEVMPGGALEILEQGVLDGVREIVALHTEPKLPIGVIGTRIGPITSATDEVVVTLTSTGGHTSRPHLTGDVVFALGEVITQVPGVLGRRLDPRSGVNLTWGMVAAGDAHNAIPAAGKVAGTLRCLDARAWEGAGEVLDHAIAQVVAPYAVDVELTHIRGVPPVENDKFVTQAVERAAAEVVGPRKVVVTEQSLGGEDFAWYLSRVPGAMVRLGTAAPGAPQQDLHQGDLDIDEAAVGIGAAFFANYVLNS